MRNQMLVSIIIPLYNKEQYFERCFNSVAKQTYKNIECIIVEDCSTDNSLKLAEHLVRNYVGNIKFVLIKHEFNIGLSAARNTGINNSNGEYVYFLDSDDEITDNCISSLVMLVEKYPDIDIVQGNMYQYPRAEKDIYDIKGKLPEFIRGNLEIKKCYFNRLPVNAVNKLIRKKFITQNYLYFRNKLIHEDEHWYFFAIKKLESFAFTYEYCYIRYFLPDTIMTNPNLFPSISGYLTVIEDMLSNLDVDMLEKQLYKVHLLLNISKDKIMSDEKYSSLMLRYETLSAKVPNTKFLMTLIMWDIKRQVKQTIKTIIRKICGQRNN